MTSPDAALVERARTVWGCKATGQAICHAGCLCWRIAAFAATVASEQVEADLRALQDSKAVCEDYRLKGLAKTQELEGRLRKAEHEREVARADLRATVEAWTHQVHRSSDIMECSFSYGGPNYRDQDGERGLCTYAPHWYQCEHCAARAALARPGVQAVTEETG